MTAMRREQCSRDTSVMYLDYNATAPLYPEVIAVMTEAMAAPANPSSVHHFGRTASACIERARRSIAEAISCFPQEIIFVSCGTEANHLALNSFPGRPLLVSAIEHSAVLKGLDITGNIIPVTPDGVVNLDALERMLAPMEAPLVSVMLANNETGVIQPIAEVARLVHARGGLLHTDAVQALGKMPLDVNLLGADMVSISAHKFGGPQGIAALVVRQGVDVQPVLKGGGQELSRRAGTEHVAGIIGFAKAVELATRFDWQSRLRGWLDAMETQILAFAQHDTSIILGRNAPRLPNTSAILMPGKRAETQLMHFDLGGIAISAGSACSSGRIEPSHVVRAMGIDPGGDQVIRVSGGWATTEQEIQRFTEIWRELAQ